jgi:hypothetical protein
MEQTWKSPSRELPPPNVVVRTMDSTGREQDLKLSGRLWFFPDGGMYVYYVPTFWRALTPDEAAQYRKAEAPR